MRSFLKHAVRRLEPTSTVQSLPALQQQPRVTLTTSSTRSMPSTCQPILWP
jgi:hypothetical protein